MAVALCKQYDLDGYIANAENAYEGQGAWKSEVFVDEFTRLAPYAPLALSYIGDGYPYRHLDFHVWIEAGAALMPQCYWGNSATSIEPSLQALERYGLKDTSIVFPTLGTSGFTFPYPAEFYDTEVTRLDQPYNVWLLESTSDDFLRVLHG